MLAPIVISALSLSASRYHTIPYFFTLPELLLRFLHSRHRSHGCHVVDTHKSTTATGSWFPGSVNQRRKKGSICDLRVPGWETG
ncbi:hypothetical protein P152DRAFT_453943 [Eremomyces bilateralis CBS 781.70]|uniref:Uncharacterized protein n=1 Tax=Eremomyces bilateralis CBS 781.70 TaxID=1392243 RepID=A0A6G1GHI6_9PEZI|nr:uncharacterized protein P152DRAFT_453943 [Eremomyces bilateralis CBS 781.70]KAF1817361.1 hypothetical protein P152DRAFT_453943 [Eremomyces bilateralis CBS 781.70]